MSRGSHEPVAEERQSLWLLTVSPAIWAAHFLASYIGAAVWCGLAGSRAAGLGGLRTVVLATAVLALGGIAITGWTGWRKHRHNGYEPPHDEDTPEDRHRFLGLATVLLSALSAIATVYVAAATLLIEDCQ
jgi:hypothetical protein